MCASRSIGCGPAGCTDGLTGNVSQDTCPLHVDVSERQGLVPVRIHKIPRIWPVSSFLHVFFRAYRLRQTETAETPCAAVDLTDYEIHQTAR